MEDWLYLNDRGLEHGTVPGEELIHLQIEDGEMWEVWMMVGVE